jgi:hypothetical protein
MTDFPDDPVSVLFQLGLGPWCIPLSGKLPIMQRWNTRPPVDEVTVRGWLAKGHNLGLRTGVGSGVIVIDDDRPKHGLPAHDCPPTGLRVSSPTGSMHHYYRRPPGDDCPRNSTSKIAPNVDVRGEGGFVVVPPSIHPTAGEEYRWAALGEPAPWQVEPELELPEIIVDMTAPATTGQGYAQAALLREAHAVRTAAEGTRNDTLNTAAYSLGQLVAGGALDAETVRSELMSAALMCGLPEREAQQTIARAIQDGSAKPRTVPPPRPAITATAAAQSDAKPGKYILVPGSHVVEGGEYIEQGGHVFAAQVVAKMPASSLYRRAGQLGEVTEGQFLPVSIDRLRGIIDSGVRLGSSKLDEDEDKPTITYRPCSRDHAGLVLAHATAVGGVRELRYVATHPVCVAPDYAPARPGWNDASGTYLACTLDPAPLTLDYARAVIDDLICDFPFQTPADRHNFIGLLLTPIMRPAINEPVPMHLVCSPMPGSGKSMLAQVVLGVSITGQRLADAQLGDREEEREKRITSFLLAGQSLVNIDNLDGMLDSPTLASLLTSSVYQGRVLGLSQTPRLINSLTVVGTGNNVHVSDEIARRIVPIRLLPNVENPGARSDFKHPDLYRYVVESRPTILAALLGLIQTWRDQGCPTHRTGFGSFERWTGVVGGILNACGYSAWLTNMGDWRGVSDDSTQEHATLVAAWHERYACEPVPASDIYQLAVDLDLYGWLDTRKGERSARTSFGRRVLSVITDRIIGGFRIESNGVGGRRTVRLRRPE